MSTRVIHVRDMDRRNPDHVYIGRRNGTLPGSKWQNPYKIGVHGNRAEVIEKYRLDILASPDHMAALEELRGKTLCCWCYPQPCHGNVLIELLGEGEPKAVQMGLFAE